MGARTSGVHRFAPVNHLDLPPYVVRGVSGVRRCEKKNPTLGGRP